MINMLQTPLHFVRGVMFGYILKSQEKRIDKNGKPLFFFLHTKFFVNICLACDLILWGRIWLDLSINGSYLDQMCNFKCILLPGLRMLTVILFQNKTGLGQSSVLQSCWSPESACSDAEHHSLGPQLCPLPTSLRPASLGQILLWAAQSQAHLESSRLMTRGDLAKTKGLPIISSNQFG